MRSRRLAASNSEDLLDSKDWLEMSSGRLKACNFKDLRVGNCGFKIGSSEFAALKSRIASFVRGAWNPYACFQIALWILRDRNKNVCLRTGLTPVEFLSADQRIPKSICTLKVTSDPAQ